MKLTYNLVLSVLALFVFISSCKKAPACKENCAVINANGKVINKLTATSAAGVPVSLSWVKFVGGFSQKQVITTVTSKADGSFNFSSNVDTGYFSNGYFLSLKAGSGNEYIILGYSGFVETRTYKFNQTAFQNIQFEVYKKAVLKITLNRALNDHFQSYSISHSNVTNDFLYDYNVQSPQEVIDRNVRVLNVVTVADVFTKIKTVKTFTNGTSIITLDSVKCIAGSSNVYNVTF